MQHDNVYKPSGRFSIAGLMSAMAKAAGCGAAAGALYAVISYYSPFFIINMIVWVAVALVVGYFSEEAVRGGKLRNSVVAAFVGLSGASVAVVVHWAIWMRLMAEQWILDPATALALIEGIAAIGAWTVFDWTPRGTMLLTIWGLETLLILLVPIVMARNVVRDTPFCETTGTWAEVSYPKKNFAKCDVKNIRDQIRQSPGALLNLLKPPAASDSEFTRFALAQVGDSGLRTVALSTVTTKVKDGKVEENAKTVLNHVIVDVGTFDKISAACG